MDATQPSRVEVVAIVPVGSLERAKSRLGAVLDAEERRDLVLRLAEQTIRAVVGTPGVTETLVITPDDEIRDLASRVGARPIRQRSRGLNDGLREARAEAMAGGADAIVVVPIDIPQISSELLAPIIDMAVDPPPGPLVVIVPDRHDRGTNLLLLEPPDVIDFCFGGDSKAAHLEAATSVPDSMVPVLYGPLTLDLDTPDDLLLAEASGEIPESIGG